MRALAINGTTLMLPNHSTIKKEFGVHKFGPIAGKERSLAQTALLYDVLNLVSVDAQIASYATSEKELLYRHLEYLKPDDLLLIDRVYLSKALFFSGNGKRSSFLCKNERRLVAGIKSV